MIRCPLSGGNTRSGRSAVIDNGYLRAYRAIVIYPLAVPDAHSDAALRRGTPQLVILFIFQRRRVLAVIRHGVEEVAAADGAAPLSVHAAHQPAPAVLGANAVGADTGGRRFLAGGTGEGLDGAGIIAAVVLAVDHGGLAALVNDDIIGRIVVLIGRNAGVGLGGSGFGGGSGLGRGRGLRRGRGGL